MFEVKYPEAYCGKYYISIYLEGVIYMGSVTTNPWLISIINMTIVFGVLIALGVLMSMIQLVDPTRNKH